MADKKPSRDMLGGITRQGTREGGPARLFESMDPKPMLEMLQKMIMGEQRVPRLNEPLPRIDPATGQVIEPPGGPMGRRGGIFGQK